MFGAVMSAQQPPLVASGISPKEATEQLWTMATRGELLTPEGWDKASRSFFMHPASAPENKVVFVVSNYWGPPSEQIKGDKADVTVGFGDAGKIDSALRYLPPQPTRAIKTGMLYHFVLAPTHWTMFKSDGKAITGKEEKSGPVTWQIDDPPGPPWTTVNTAIRYVLEIRNKTTDPVIKKNADETLLKLLRLH
jgi:hypothetical protein